MISKKTMPAALLLLLWAPVLALGQGRAPAGKYANWLDEEAALIISTAEREVFGGLTSDRDRDRFIEEFWRQRDPTPGTPANEVRTEHERRLDYVNKRFNAGGSLRGWKTDRGRTLVILGQPADVQRVASADTVPLEIWYYLTEARWDMPTYFRLLFFQEYGADEYRLYDPGKDGPKSLVPFPDRWRPGRNIVPGEAAAAKPDPPGHWTADDKRAYQVLVTYVTGEAAEASVSCFPGFAEAADAVRSSELIGGLGALPARRVDEGRVRAFANDPAAAEVSYSLQPVDCRAALTARAEGPGNFTVDYVLGPRAVAFDRFGERSFAGLRTTIRVSDAAGKTVFQDVRFTPVELSGDELQAVSENSPEVHGSFRLGPGDFTVEIRLEDTVSKEFSTISRPLSLPPGPEEATAAPGPAAAAGKPGRGVWIINQ